MSKIKTNWLSKETNVIFCTMGIPWLASTIPKIVRDVLKVAEYVANGNVLHSVNAECLYAQNAA